MISSNYSNYNVNTHGLTLQKLCKWYLLLSAYVIVFVRYQWCWHVFWLLFGYKDKRLAKQSNDKVIKEQNIRTFQNSTKNRHALSYKLTSIWPCKRLSININRGSVISSLAAITYKGNPDRNYKALKTVSTWKYIFHTEKLPACYYI